MHMRRGLIAIALAILQDIILIAVVTHLCTLAPVTFWQA